jgi:hypothetical protein
VGGADQGGRMPESYATGGDYFPGDTIPGSERGFLVHTEKDMLTLPIISLTSIVQRRYISCVNSDFGSGF